MVKLVKRALQKFLRKRGILLVRYHPRNSDEAMLEHLLQSHRIDLVFDIGGNSGQYAQSLRKKHYGGKIVSCEPLKNVFAQLAQNAETDSNWEVHQVAIGREAGESVINVSENTYSSSLLGMHDTHQKAAPVSRYINTETIRVVPLTQIATPELLKKHQNILLKVDVQGFEREVIEGALEVLPKITLVELELSMVPLYEDGPLYRELIDRMEELGFELFTLMPEFRDPDSHRLLQTNGLFINRKALSS